jgi:hypothetical protein
MYTGFLTAKGELTHTLFPYIRSRLVKRLMAVRLMTGRLITEAFVTVATDAETGAGE